MPSGMPSALAFPGSTLGERSGLSNTAEGVGVGGGSGSRGDLVDGWRGGDFCPCGKGGELFDGGFGGVNLSEGGSGGDSCNVLFWAAFWFQEDCS